MSTPTSSKIHADIDAKIQATLDAAKAQVMADFKASKKFGGYAFEYLEIRVRTNCRWVELK